MDGARGELAALLQPARLVTRLPALVRAPRGDGGTVIAIPGWKSPEAAMTPLAAYLRRLGFDARGWGLGTNEGEPERDAERMVDVVRRAASAGDGTVALVGWSLGGTIAREVAREVPDLVHHVVTYGTAAVGGPTYALAAHSWGPEESRRIEQMLAERDRTDPIRVPITAIFSRNDRIVDWRACLDHTSPDVDHVEVTSPHLGMGIDPDVWLAVAVALASTDAGRVS
jgi:pimeloyl-ACP methyl ester carboxylesterase